MHIGKPRKPWPKERTERLVRELAGCADVAFAHLPEVLVPARQTRPNRVLFVWVVPEAMGALRATLNTICDAVARAIPRSEFVDVVILNSAPELLLPVEEAGCLLLENDPEERRMALEAARVERDASRAAPEEPPLAPSPWWAFWRR